MSAAEIVWRFGNLVRNSANRCVWPIRRRIKPAHCRIPLGKDGDIGKPHLFGSHWPSIGQVDGDDEFAWRWAVVDQAERILQGRLQLLGGEETNVGPKIDWNYEYRHGVSTPNGFSASIDYRNFEIAGDAKWIWELNRHHHLVVLGRAYRLTGDPRFASTAVSQLESWLEQCPEGTGMNWRSPLELAIRLINWVWLLELIRPSGLIRGSTAQRILLAAQGHLRAIARRYSRHSSANNHLIGEAAGVFIGSTYFSELADAGRWAKKSREILIREILTQTNPDGGHRELATGYHVFVLQFFLLCGLCARNTADDFPASYWRRLEKMFEFVSALAEGGRPPMFGDSDDGYVVDLGGVRGDVRPLLAIGDSLFGREDFRPLVEGGNEPAFWLLGTECRKRQDSVVPDRSAGQLRSKAFPDSGYYLLQCGDRDAPDRISATFDCGELGFGSIAAHGHADALSFTLRVGGRDILVDPGTYDYFTFPAWRDYFRSTRAHNTIAVNDHEQSQACGLFLWGRRARARCLRWEIAPDRTAVAGEHDGYRDAANPVDHRRTLVLDANSRLLQVVDEIVAPRPCRARFYLHFAEDCDVELLADNRCRVIAGEQLIEIQCDSRLRLSEVRGSEAPILGWISRAYHHKIPTTTLVGDCTVEGRTELTTRVECFLRRAAAEARPSRAERDRRHRRLDVGTEKRQKRERQPS